MHRLSRLMEGMTPVSQPKLVASGVGMWLVWDGQLSPVLSQIFTEFGGFQKAQDGNQALWFFFGDEAFRALGRLAGYARVNRLPLFVQTFPAQILLGYKFEQTLACAEEYLNQEAGAPQDLEIFVHPQFSQQIESLPGLSVKPAPPMPGLAQAGFNALAIDTTMAQESTLGWYFMLRPLGDPLDKNCAEGWRAIFSELQTLLEKLAVKYLSHEGYIIFGVDNIRSFRNITRELLKLESAIKSPESGKKYWPCVMACVFKKGQHFNKDLPKRVNLDWRQLTPDYPHMSFKSALYLGPGFKVNDVRHSSGSLTIDDWCHISLAPEEESGEAQGELAFSLPGNLVAGTNPHCFYCGLTGHEPLDCPSKSLTTRDESVWQDIGMIGLDDLEQAGMSLNQGLAGSGVKGLLDAMESKDAGGLLVRGVMEAGFPTQLRCVPYIWRSKGRDLPAGFNDLSSPDEGEYLWEALDAARHGDLEAFEREIAQGLAKYGRGFQPRSIQGFVAMEQADWSRAAYFWQEAARSAFTPLQRGWLAFLEGRALEVQGDCQKAVGLYRQAKSECPRWIEPVYRQGACMVKLGFTDQGLYDLLDLVRSHPPLFNRILLDPELERGRIHALQALWRPWSEAKAARDEKAVHLKGLPEYLKSWFREDHPFLKDGLEKAGILAELAKIDNYVCFDRVVREYDLLQKDLHNTVEKEVSAMNARLKGIHEDLKDIHHEAAWFPFGKLLREFNKDFNACANKLNWMRATSLQVAANFRKSQDYIEEIDASINLLKARLVTLRIVRDATLFVLLLGKSFMWLELIGLALSLVAVPGVIFLAHKTGQSWLAGILETQKWQVQKGLVIIVSIVAMALAAIKTALSFERKRAELFKEEEEKAAKAKPVKGKAGAKALPEGKGGAVPAKAGGGKPVAGKGKGKG
ncbi:MAG: tetratricopeptide repeat protein [Thermodesulfobacteriota bacterium]